MLEDAPCCDVYKPFFKRIGEGLESEDIGNVHRAVKQLTSMRSHEIDGRVFLIGSNA